MRVLAEQTVENARTTGASAWAASVGILEGRGVVSRIGREAEGSRLVLALVNQVKGACELYDWFRDKTQAGQEVVLSHGRVPWRDRRGALRAGLGFSVKADGEWSW